MLLLLPTATLAAEEAWIELCGSDAEAVEQQRQYLSVDGSSRWLRIVDEPTAGCESRSLGSVGVRELTARPLWFGLIPTAKASRLHRGVVLQGLLNDERLQVSEVEVSQPGPDARLPLPLATNLIARLHPTTYGVEERAALAVEEGALLLHCRAGAKPAGLVLRNDGARLPAPIALDLSLDYQADDGFRVGYADGLQHPLSDPAQLGHLPQSQVAAEYRLPGGDGNNSKAVDATFAVTLMCPNSGGHLLLAQLQLATKSKRIPPPRSNWIWRPSEWLQQPDQLLTELESLQTTIAYVSVPIDAGQVVQGERLSEFVSAANQRGIEIWAVEGDPHAVLPDGQAVFAERARALAAYNAAQPDESRLHGVQYDIEPYLLPEFALHTNDWLEAYVETIAMLDGLLDVPLEIAVPFWWSALMVNNTLLLNALGEHVQSVNVMNYRTERDQLQQFAEPFLAWGAERGVEVRVALEAGPIVDEQRWHFQRAENQNAARRLWHLELGDEQLLLLLAQPVKIPFAQGYQRVRQSTFPSERLTFRNERSRMEKVMDELEPLWSAWPSFAGLALHEYRMETPDRAKPAQGE